MVGICSHTTTNHFSQDRGIPANGMFILFKDDGTCTFAHDKTIPMDIEGSGGTSWIFIKSG